METFVTLLIGFLYVVGGLLALFVLLLCAFLWMVSTRTRQDSKIFQERFDGWRKSRR